MPRAIHPASPIGEVVQRRHARQDFGVRNPLTAELAGFMQSGISIILASVDDDGTPLPGKAQGCRVDPSGMVRVTIIAQPYARLLNALSRGRPLAATFSRPEDHRSIQLKSASAKLVDPGPADREAALVQGAGLSDQLVLVGYDRAFSDAYASCAQGDLAVIAFVPEQAFVQTPGPGAGTALKQP